MMMVVYLNNFVRQGMTHTTGAETNFIVMICNHSLVTVIGTMSA